MSTDSVLFSVLLSAESGHLCLPDRHSFDVATKVLDVAKKVANSTQATPYPLRLPLLLY